MRGGESGFPCLVLRTSSTGRSALLLADIDRCADRERQPDHLHLLASIVKWARGPKPTFEAVTSGDVSLDVYTQGDRVIVHLSNEIATSTMPARQARVIKSAPVEFSLALRGARVATAHARVASSAIDTSQSSDRLTVRVEAIDDHQVVVVDYE